MPNLSEVRRDILLANRLPRHALALEITEGDGARSFLHGLGADRRDLAVLRAILAIGDGMDIQVVAEGIETPRQRELLRLSGCPFGQGFLFSRALPADEIVIGRRERYERPEWGAVPEGGTRLAASLTE